MSAIRGKSSAAVRALVFLMLFAILWMAFPAARCEGGTGADAGPSGRMAQTSAGGAAGSIIMDAASLLLMGGLLLYTSLYRKRGRLDDRMFFALIVINMVLAAADALTYMIDGSDYPGIQAVLIVGNLVFFAAFEIFPCLYMFYLDYRARRDEARIRRMLPWFSIPCAILLLLLPVSVLTGWIFSVDADGLYRAGPWNDLVFVPVAFYMLMSMLIVRRINTRLVLLELLIVCTRVLWGIWFREISSTALTYTLFLVCTHIHVMNQPLIEETL